MLLPPPDSTLREGNANFAFLYDHLITNILNEDGSTRSTATEHDAVIERLHEARKTMLRDAILIRALEEVAIVDKSSSVPSADPTNRKTTAHVQKNEPNSLPLDLRALIFNITPYLAVSLDPETNGSLPPDTNGLMVEELEEFHHHLPEISQHLSTHLVSLHGNLADLATSLSQPHPTPSKTVSSLSESLTSLTTSQSATTLRNLLSENTQSLSSLLSKHAQDLQRTIRHLELSVHGTSARHLASRSTYLHAVSRGVGLKAQTLRLEKEKALYTSTTDTHGENLMDVLGEEFDGLQSLERKLVKRERELRAVLEEYDVAGGEAVLSRTEGGNGEDVFKVLGERYAEIEAELNVVKTDVERLEERWLRPRESRGKYLHE